MYVRIHQTEKGKVVAACDENLVGKILDDGKAFMDLDRYRSFYVGEKSDEEGLRSALADFASANLVGKESVGTAIKAGVAADVDIMYINKTPYIQIYSI